MGIVGLELKRALYMPLEACACVYMSKHIDGAGRGMEWRLCCSEILHLSPFLVVRITYTPDILMLPLSRVLPRHPVPLRHLYKNLLDRRLTSTALIDTRRRAVSV